MKKLLIILIATMAVSCKVSHYHYHCEGYVDTKEKFKQRIDSVLKAEKEKGKNSNLLN